MRSSTTLFGRMVVTLCLFAASVTILPSAHADGQEQNQPLQLIIKRLLDEHLVARQPAELESIAIKALYQLAGITPPAPSESLSLRTAWDRVRQQRPDLPELALRDAAAKALMDSYHDKRSHFVDAEGFSSLLAGNTRDNSGVGLGMRKQDELVQVLWTHPGSPARRAGIPEYSQLLSINDTPVAGKTLAEIGAMLRGPIGSDVDVQLRLPDGKPRAWLLERELMKPASVEVRMLDEQTAYLRLYALGSNAAQELGQALQRLQQQASLAGVILDLRQNSGGLLSEAVAVTDLFLAGGNIFCLRTRNEQGDCYQADATQIRPGKLVVLIDQSTASGAETIAAVLQHRRLARVIGFRSYGYGGVQVVLPLLPAGSGALVITHAEIVPDGGVSFHDKGVVPDICMDGVQTIPATASLENIKHVDCRRGERRVIAGANDPDIDIGLRYIREAR